MRKHHDHYGLPWLRIIAQFVQLIFTHFYHKSVLASKASCSILVLPTYPLGYSKLFVLFCLCFCHYLSSVHSFSSSLRSISQRFLKMPGHLIHCRGSQILCFMIRKVFTTNSIHIKLVRASLPPAGLVLAKNVYNSAVLVRLKYRGFILYRAAYLSCTLFEQSQHRLSCGRSVTPRH